MKTMKTPQKKRRILMVTTIVVLAMLVLAAGIPDLVLLPGHSWEFWRELLLGNFNMAVTPLPPGYSATGLVRALRLFFLLLMLMVPVLIIAMIISPDIRKQILRDLARASLVILLALLFLRSGVLQHIGELPQTFQTTTEQSIREQEFTPFSETMPEFTPSSPPWLVWGASFLLALLVGGGLAWIAWLLWQRHIRQTSPLEELAEEAQTALDALQAGADLRNTVVRCYQQMSEVLKKERGIQRERAMTPRKFEQRLATQGLPPAAVQQLTRLFEAVRYGTIEPSERENQQAIASLSTIIQACE